MKGVKGILPLSPERCDKGEKDTVDIMAIAFVCGGACTLVSMGYKQKERKQNDEIIQSEMDREINHTGVRTDNEWAKDNIRGREMTNIYVYESRVSGRWTNVRKTMKAPLAKRKRVCERERE
jgi:hypothetical protein